MPTDLEGQLERLPDRTGVYIFRDASGNPLYIGKARSLRSRVRAHFHAGRPLDARTMTMLDRVATIDYLTTGSEVEALILESNLIKEHHPEYNLKLRDDKHFPYLRVDLEQPYPRVEIVRRMKRDGARYFGPYTRSGSLRETLRTLRRVFPYRVCSDHRLRNARRPCLDFHIGRCLGPCAGAVTPEEYRAMMEELCLFLEGRRTKLVSRLKARMEEEAARLRFERAAELRDQIRAIEDVSEKQAAILTTMEDQDALGYARAEESGLAAVAVLNVREGKLVGRTGFFLDEARGASGTDVLAAFLKQHYGQRAGFIPERILLPEELPSEEAEPIGAWLGSLAGRPVRIASPKRGPARRLVDLARQNAVVLLREELARRQTGSEAAYARAAALAEALGLEAPPDRIEAYDISSIHGHEAVGAMVVFVGGRPAPAGYRRFRVRREGRPDDYAMMQEVLFRRFRRLSGEEPAEDGLDGFGPAPDLVIIDGGKGHLAAAAEVLEDLDLDIPVAALAKEREEVFVPGRPEPLDLEPDSPAGLLLRHIRDEAHRFAVGYHRLLHRKVSRRSELDDIPGVGPARRTALLRAFGSVAGVKAAREEELAAVKGVGPAAARRIWEYLHGGSEGGDAGNGAREKG